jgi:hypothetical protein
MAAAVNNQTTAVKYKAFKFASDSGAGDGSRTRDPQLGRLALYQLSYTRILAMVGRGGFEPP